MNKTIKNYKEAEKGCGKKKHREDTNLDYNCGTLGILCDRFYKQREISETALQEMKKFLDYEIEFLTNLRIANDHRKRGIGGYQRLQRLKEKRQKIQEALEK